MSPEKDAALCKDFPHLFRDRNASIMNSAFGFGFETGDGWYSLIHSAASKIEPIIVKMIDEAIKTKKYDVLDYLPTTIQIKEKYGTLVWYMSCMNEEIDSVIDETEKKSAETCEECGELGKLRGKMWLSTRCDACWKKTWEEKHHE